MQETLVTAADFLQHIRTANEPFILKNKGQPPQWSDEALHNAFYTQNPELYALFALGETLTVPQQTRMLFTLLQGSRAGMSQALRQTLERVTEVLLALLNPDAVLTVFLALRRVRANHKHTTRAILTFILNHPQFEDLALRRRPAVVDALEHALGKNVARGAVKKLADAEANAAYLHQNLLRRTHQPARIKALLPHLYRPPVGQGFLPPTGEVQYTLTHQQYAEKITKSQERPSTITATNRGEIAATLVHLYRGGYSEELQKSLELSVQAASVSLPHFAGKVALVFDASASTRSYGDREYCVLSQAVAFKLLLAKCCEQLQVYGVDSSRELPTPQGATDLATGLIDALETRPDLVVIVSDGYENCYPGDLARIVATLPQLGMQTPVVFCHSKFTDRDDLSLRRPATNLPQLEFWHQGDFSELMLMLFSRVPGPLSTQCLQEFFRRKLDTLEKELMLWTLSN